MTLYVIMVCLAATPTQCTQMHGAFGAYTTQQACTTMAAKFAAKSKDKNFNCVLNTTSKP